MQKDGGVCYQSQRSAWTATLKNLNILNIDRKLQTDEIENITRKIVINIIIPIIH